MLIIKLHIFHWVILLLAVVRRTDEDSHVFLCQLTYLLDFSQDFFSLHFKQLVILRGAQIIDFCHVLIELPCYELIHKISSLCQPRWLASLLFGVEYLVDDIISQSAIVLWVSIAQLVAGLPDSIDLVDVIEDLANHQLHSLDVSVLVVVPVQFVATVENVHDLIGIFGWITQSLSSITIVNDLGLRYQEFVLDKYAFDSEVVGISAKIIKFIHIDAGCLVAHNLVLPLTHWVVRNLPVDQADYPLYSRGCQDIPHSLPSGNVFYNLFPSVFMVPACFLLFHELCIKHVAKWPMADVVQQPRQSHCQLSIFSISPIFLLVAFNEMFHVGLAKVCSADAVLESGMVGGVEYLIENTQLLDLPEPLELGCVDHSPHFLRKPYEPMDGIQNFALMHFQNYNLENQYAFNGEPNLIVM